MLTHFLWDLYTLRKLFIPNTTVNELFIHTVGVVVVLTLPFVCLSVIYGHIEASILKVPSTKGICKVLSNCGSHLSVTCLYYGTIIVL